MWNNRVGDVLHLSTLTVPFLSIIKQKGKNRITIALHWYTEFVELQSVTLTLMKANVESDAWKYKLVAAKWCKKIVQMELIYNDILFKTEKSMIPIEKTPNESTYKDKSTIFFSGS